MIFPNLKSIFFMIIFNFNYVETVLPVGSLNFASVFLSLFLDFKHFFKNLRELNWLNVLVSFVVLKVIVS